MKKLATLTWLAACSTLAHAASADNVTLYGVVDMGVAYVNGGSTTMKAISGAGSTSRIGFKGHENLGGGWFAGFMLESGLQADTGVAGGTTLQGEQSLFNRESNIWIGSDSVGTVKLGRQYPAMISLALDPFLGVSGFSPYGTVISSNADLGRGATLGDSRISNAVSYTTPDLAGVMAQFLYAPRESTAAGYPRAADYGVEAHYSRGNLLYLGAQYNVVNTDPTATLASVKNIWSGVGVQVKLGDAILSYELNNVAPRAVGSYVAQSHMLGMTLAPNTRDYYQLALLYRNVAGAHDKNSFTVGFGYGYNLSRASTLYTRIGRVFNRSNGVSSLSGTTVTQAGDDVSVLAVGLRYRF
ncbi:porin [Herbaspirillum sp. alder98]|uniref:porin n=1 Tax=Herbaspirillum sp. alder98 TaxID=2913096 RepID=UPI001CD8841C|nr:porin [Herbaspirillum sp. alder98]MCA1323148.1 porin [Herbaspirillum sp. alder98]